MKSVQTFLGLTVLSFSTFSTTLLHADACVGLLGSLEGPGLWRQSLGESHIAVADHVVGKFVVVPFAGFMDTGFKALLTDPENFPEKVTLSNLRVSQMLVLNGEPVSVTTKLSDETIQILAHDQAEGRPSRAAVTSDHTLRADFLLKQSFADESSAKVYEDDQLYKVMFPEKDLHYGAEYQRLRSIRSDGKLALGVIITTALDRSPYALHPAIEDCLLQLALPLMLENGSLPTNRPAVPVIVDHATFFPKVFISDRLYGEARLVKAGSRLTEIDYILRNDADEIVLVLEGVKLASLPENP